GPGRGRRAAARRRPQARPARRRPRGVARPGRLGAAAPRARARHAPRGRARRRRRRRRGAARCGRAFRLRRGRRRAAAGVGHPGGRSRPRSLRRAAAAAGDHPRTALPRPVPRPRRADGAPGLREQRPGAAAGHRGGPGRRRRPRPHPRTRAGRRRRRGRHGRRRGRRATRRGGARISTRDALLADLRALRRIWPLLGVSRRRLAVAVAWGTLTLSAAVGLAAVSAWLIARASQMPSVLDLTIAVVAVRALGIGRGLFRYLDRLASHDVALRGAAHLRARLYSALAHGRTDAVATLRRGEVLRRWGADVDDVGDLVVRAVVPALVALVVSLVAVGIVGALSPLAGLVLAACLLLAGLGAPLLAARAVRAAELDGAAQRGRVAAQAMTVLDGAAELRVGGRLDPLLGELADAEDALR